MMKAKYPGLIWLLLKNTPVQFSRHNCPIMAAGMSFFAMLSLIPFTLLAVSMLGYLLGFSQDAQQFVSRLLMENFPGSAEDILNQVNAIITSPERTLVNGLSLLGLLWSGMRFFNILQRVLNTIWVGATQRKFLRGRAAAFGTFLVAGLIFWLSFAFTSLEVTVRELDISIRGLRLNNLHGFWLAVERITPFIASIIILVLVYLLIPHARVSWMAALVGATFATVLSQLARWGYSSIIVRFEVYGRIYGPLASLIVLMSWLYLSMIILLLGAELGSQYQHLFSSNTNQDFGKSLSKKEENP